MPTYEYACSSCDHQWEAEQSIKDDALKTCPKCHADTAKRQISRGTGFILKGGGWYSDLYAGSSNASKRPATEADVAGSGSKSSESAGSSASTSSTSASTGTSASTATAPSTSTASSGSTGGPAKT